MIAPDDVMRALDLISTADLAKHAQTDPLAAEVLQRRWEREAATGTVNPAHKGTPAAFAPKADPYRNAAMLSLQRLIPGNRRKLPAALRYTQEQRAKRHFRKRCFGSDGRLPPDIRGRFPEGQRAALRVVAKVFERAGRCDMEIGEIARLAGVCRRWVQYALRYACQLGLISIRERQRRGAKNLSNVITIIDENWLDWLGIGCTKVRTTEKPRFSNPCGENENPLRPVIGHRNGLLREESAARSHKFSDDGALAPP